MSQATVLIPIQEDQFNQLQAAAREVNSWNGSAGIQLRIARILPAFQKIPPMVEVQITYPDLLTLCTLFKQFGIILQKIDQAAPGR